jgi:hypothetical protein
LFAERFVSWEWEINERMNVGILGSRRRLS